MRKSFHIADVRCVWLCSRNFGQYMDTFYPFIDFFLFVFS